MDLRVYLISGFHQGRGRWNGSLNMRERLFDQFNGRIRDLTYLPWKSSWKAVAENMWLLKKEAEKDSKTPPVNIVAGYSYGGGWGARLLMKYCRPRGVTIRHAILCDPVHRGILSPLGWFGVWPIHIPANVQNVSLFRQRESFPYGCDIKVQSSDTKVVSDETLEVGHIYMDDEDRYFTEVVTAVRDALGDTIT